MAEIGATPGGGVERLALTSEDKRARDFLVTRLNEMGLDVTIDEMGNIFGTRRGSDDSSSPVMTGSHADTQPRGGRFDGILGVVAGLEVLQTLADRGIETRRPVTLVVWTNEEGSRFPPAMMASGVWAGRLELERAWRTADVDGAVFGDELERIGYKGSAPCASWPFHSYFELHIEQGPMLERTGRLIGVPKGILSLNWYDIYVDGQADHAGTTPMDARHDALVAAAEMILKVRELPAKLGGDTVATVGELHNRPNSRNVIPEAVRFSVDIRTWDDGLAQRSWEDLEADVTAIAARHGCLVRAESTGHAEHSEFAPHLVERVRTVAESLGFDTLPMVSGAVHDAGCVATAGPAAMIFVPSVGGRSHVEVEETSWDDCEAGANVLLHCVLRSANEVTP